MSKELLQIKNLYANAETKEILKGLNLTINKGEVHVIMGPNGAGKSTTASVIFNSPEYKKVSGEIEFEGENINDLSTDKIAKKGIFMSFQSPEEIPGISTMNFLKYAKNKIEDKPVKVFQLKEEVKKYIEELNMNPNLINRDLNVGFSGGEKKKNEILQLLVLNPKLAILDETDSGLDVDALRIVADGFNKLKTPQTSAMVITHYQRLLDYLKPDTVHVLLGGRIVKTGGPELAKEIEARGFDWIKKEASEL